MALRGAASTLHTNLHSTALGTACSMLWRGITMMYALVQFLVEWWQQLRMLLCMDPDGYIGCRCTAIADNVGNNFPDPHVILAYTHLTTSWSSSFCVDKIPTIGMREPDLHGLTSFCTCHFSWHPQILHEKFKHVAWDGACLRMCHKVNLF
jgi:hypothetical protein